MTPTSPGRFEVTDDRAENTRMLREIPGLAQRTIEHQLAIAAQTAVKTLEYAS
jgi:hypothetical protein